MGKHRKEGGNTPTAALRQSLLNTFRPGAQPEGTSPVRRKVVAAAVTVGAFATVGTPMVASAANQGGEQRVRPQVEQKNLGAALIGTPENAPAARLLQAKPPEDPITEKKPLDKIKDVERKRIARETAERLAAEAAAQAEAARVEAERKAADEAANASAGKVNSSGYVKPTDATFTSGFGSRWGSSHNGIDLANDIGTPIYAVTGGEVIDAGPASGFGQWIRVQHDDGTISVYGHINTIDVSVGQSVEAGEQIATMGNEGQSTGPHLHFEVIEDGEKIDPLPWLEERGISVQ